MRVVAHEWIEQSASHSIGIPGSKVNAYTMHRYRATRSIPHPPFITYNHNKPVYVSLAERIVRNASSLRMTPKLFAVLLRSRRIRAEHNIDAHQHFRRDLVGLNQVYISLLSNLAIGSEMITLLCTTVGGRYRGSKAVSDRQHLFSSM